ncbi:enoyl-CoA hydratase [Alkalilimnicola ehrlichii]|uniref:Enoyl-CoA hydratase n=1 Tax=Alkalilimnicola ehrlichii TaxID=351052 RepID=A0A3E0X3A6_9GAMM|nr:bifunctional enoyl-CoA hydratase/phosphate acetyltransferase [Alkalilimnicola ehrlichii]RFA31416.1 enoyl-CoA hydratase [Alkalilimnicola ehrlichii]RFA39312.1 enoyl-CoA hydratase [Alkalilimnicola ehrlichii]
MVGFIENFPYEELHVGQQAMLKRRLVLDELKLYAESAAEAVPTRMDETLATSDLFHQLIAHGMWGNALVAIVIATELPGPGTRLLEQRLNYKDQVSLGECVTVTVTVKEKLNERRVLLECLCVADDERVALAGDILVEVPKDKIKRPLKEVKGINGSGRHRQLERMLAMAEGLEPVKTAVVHPVDDASLRGVVEAARHRLIAPILVGPPQKINAAADAAELDIAGFEIVATEHSHEAAERAMDMVRATEVELVMKGALHTDELMGAAVHKEKGVRTERRMSHVWVMDVPTYPRPLFITDAAININPNLVVKRDIVQNAIELAHALGIEEPKVAILSATESVNPLMPSTLDAAALCKMADRGQIRGGLLDGPLAFDNAISEAAARTKNIRSKVAGHADILLAPDMEAGNMIGKQLNYLADADAAGIVLGARVPIILTSRADDTVSRLASCAIARLLAEKKRREVQDAAAAALR